MKKGYDFVNTEFYVDMVLSFLILEVTLLQIVAVKYMNHM